MPHTHVITKNRGPDSGGGRQRIGKNHETKKNTCIARFFVVSFTPTIPFDLCTPFIRPLVFIFFVQSLILISLHGVCKRIRKPGKGHLLRTTKRGYL